MYFITTKRMLEVCFFQHTPTFIIEPFCVIFKFSSQNIGHENMRTLPTPFHISAPFFSDASWRIFTRKKNPDKIRSIFAQ